MTYLTYDDIQLVPGLSDIKSRQSISLTTKLSRNYNIHIPIVGSPMDTVCESEMAYKLYQLGGVGCLHRFCTIDEQCEEVINLREKINADKLNSHHDECSPKDIWIEEVPIMAAIGVQEDDKQRAKRLAAVGANVLLIDVAHGDHQNVISMIKWCKEKLPSHVDIIAGNIATAAAAERLQDAGADGLRVGIGGGSLCTTRIKTGFGVPNVSCLLDIATIANVPIMADGGIRSSGDIAKALAVGADNVMIGSLIAGTIESPGQMIEKGNALYKRYRGSASLETKTKHGQAQRNVEGESTIIPFKGGAKYIIKGLTDGVRSALSYAGAKEIKTFYPKYVQVTNSGINEAKPHLL